MTLGCRLNLAESEAIRAALGNGSNTVVVNSCAVTAEAVRQSRRAVRRLRRAHPDARLLVTGCAATIEPDSFAAMTEVDEVISNTAKARLLETARPDVSRHTRAFVPVQTGCDHACTFCVIPQGRGVSVSTPVEAVLRTVERHLCSGVQEIVLTGVDVTGWGADFTGSQRLGALVSAILDAFPGLDRLRLSSLDGVEIDDELFALITQEPRVMPHVHLSLQSGDDMVLKRMKRRHTRAEAVALADRLRTARPNIAIGADLIAGFPTETAEMHANNVAIVRDCAIVHGHVFPYSPRPGTPAARMPQVPPPLVRERAAEIRAAVATERTRWLESLVGKPARVLAERDGTGHSPEFAPYLVPAGTEPGAIVTLTPTRIIEGMLA